ncbi:methionine-rich copper-binding protein CopC [Microbacterium endophyticum]|uniref:Methionine-rich copper-binding protein CopC n=1 Tax=Microbacterium endophyticum TaxID=1526412 RepID=A0A7W4V445_9MICO|nr:copper resistance CopC family protein [Microbacterium endophyticum]MBB2975935.1 methionine-rich copper-binding protein CopC [Microbacterium endophyticum]NIK37696.1 methionine-rich copper-binding protein CopC [Microbacterium endophyticum]
MRKIRTFAAGMLVGAVVILATAVPASAHDELLESSPAYNAQLDAAPTEITLTFSADVLEMGAVVIVADANDTDWAASEPEISGESVTVGLQTDMPDAGYEVRWRVVSSDGHPISGVIPFTIGNASPLVRASAGPSETATPSPTTNTQITSEDGGALRPIVIGVIGAAAAVAIFAVILYFRRRAHAGGTDDEPRAPSEKL